MAANTRTDLSVPSGPIQFHSLHPFIRLGVEGATACKTPPTHHGHNMVLHLSFTNHLLGRERKEQTVREAYHKVMDLREEVHNR